MQVKTPEYWQQAEFQPLVEVKTLYGNKVKIPERFLDIWEIFTKANQKKLLTEERVEASGWRKAHESRRGRYQTDTIRVFFEAYSE